ncbi:MAG: LacI family DNA-binding transcriptional regulator [Clostridia bacterium]|nr:LacI family DNA-binding transcriptional regulator [Clostridia bacterium]
MANPTIKSVAEDAGVSIATVSRVINKNGYVSAELEARVLRSIANLGYYPNSIARSLRYENTLSIGLVLSDISNSFFCVVLRSLEDATIAHGFNVIACSTDGLRDRELARIQLLLGKRVDGIVLNTCGFNDDYISAISHDIPMVLCGRRINSDAFIGDFVDSDNEQGSFMLTRHLIEQGHRRIAIVNGQGHVSSAQERGRGYMDAMATIGIRVAPGHPYFYEADFHNSATGAEGARALLSLDEPPTAIIAMNNELCIGAMRYCRENGVRIPEQLSLCSYGQLENDDLLYVHPSYVTMDPQTIGRRIGEIMLERISSKNKLPNREIRYSPTLVPGDGVRPLRADQ